MKKVFFLAQVFSCEFCGISKNTYFTEHIWVTASVQSCLKDLDELRVKTNSFREFIYFFFKLGLFSARSNHVEHSRGFYPLQPWLC